MPTAGIDLPEHIEPFDPTKRPGVISLRKSEFGYVDPVLKAGRWRLLYYPIREQDPKYYDPPVKGFGPGGLEKRSTTELNIRDQPGRLSHYEWRDLRYFLDPNVKAIYEKYPISRHHPGLLFRPSGNELEMTDKHHMGNILPTFGFVRHWPGILPQSWKFYAAPFGEDCHVKTAVAAKWGFIFGTSFFGYYATTLMLGHHWKVLFKKFLYFNSFTVPMGAAWATSSCLAANIRGKDDFLNMIVGGISVGCVMGAHRGFFYGYASSIVASLVGLFWYYGIAMEQGTGAGTGLTTGSRNTITYDPASYKWARWESSLMDPKPLNF